MADIGYFKDILDSDKRAGELAAHDGPIVGTLCNFSPEEIIVAAGGVPLRLCGGDHESASGVEASLPRDVCSVARSSLGMLGDGVFGHVDLLVAPTSRESRTNMVEALAAYGPVHSMLLPSTKSAPGASAAWLGEVEGFRERMIELSGMPIDRSALREGIELLNARQKAFRRFFELRYRDPPIVTGAEALYVAGASFIDDPARWTERVGKLCDELQRDSRATGNAKGPRLLLTGAPLVYPNFRLAEILEQAGAVIVADDICSSTQRLYQPAIPAEWSMRGMLEAVAEKYLLPSVCPCFTDGSGRVNKLAGWAEDFEVAGAVYHTLSACPLFDVESQQLGDALQEIDVPMLTLQTGPGPEDSDEVRDRVEAFIEMIGSR